MTAKSIKRISSVKEVLKGFLITIYGLLLLVTIYELSLLVEKDWSDILCWAFISFFSYYGFLKLAEKWRNG